MEPPITGMAILYMAYTIMIGVGLWVLTWTGFIDWPYWAWFLILLLPFFAALFRQVLPSRPRPERTPR